MGTAANRYVWAPSQTRKGTQAPRQTPPGTAAEGRGATRLASSRTGENSPYGMSRGGGGNVGRTYPDSESGFATMPETADTQEAIGLNRSRLHSTRPVNPCRQPPTSLLYQPMKPNISALALVLMLLGCATQQTLPHMKGFDHSCTFACNDIPPGTVVLRWDRPQSKIDIISSPEQYLPNERTFGERIRGSL